jgi:anti-sigma factor RsiW
MNDCSAVQAGFAEYLDGRLNGHAMQDIAAHLRDCQTCAHEWKSLRHAQSSLAALGPVPEPEDLLLRIRVAVSQERARKGRRRFEAAELVWKNTVGPFLLQASAGFASAVLLLGTVILMVSMFAQPETAQANADEPLGNASAPRLLYLSSGADSDDIGAAAAAPVVVEAYVNGEGQVYDYRIVSGPTDMATRSQVENLLLFSVFEPARFFGQPVRGLAVLSFSGVSVRG